MWLIAAIRALVASASFALGAVHEFYPEDAARRLIVSIALGICVFLLVLVIEYRASVRPALHVDRVRSLVLAQLSKQMLSELRSSGVRVRLSLMVPFRPLKWLGVRRAFRIVWSDGMEGCPDVDFRPSIGSLSMGECFRAKLPVVASRNVLERQRWGLLGRRRAPYALDAVCSYPVYEPTKGQAQQSGRIVGILPSEATQKLLSSEDPPRVPAVVDEKLRELAEISGHLVL